METTNQLGNDKNKLNAANNAKAVKIAADIASKSGNPYAKAIGTGVKVADKISGGRASNFLGKKLNTANKLAPMGGLAQAGLNKIASSGTADRINAATSKKSNFFGGFFSNKEDEPVSQPPENVDNSSTNTEESSSETSGTFEITLRHVKIALIAFTPLLAGLVIVCLIMTSSFVKLDLLTMGSADKTVELSDTEIQEAVDDNEDETTTDISINYSENLLEQKKSELVYIARRKPKNEAKLEEITDYYPIIERYRDKYDENMLYNFFYKIHLISKEYRNRYSVNVDVPLLMATLMIQAEDRDMNIVFNSNLSGEDNFYDMDKSEIDVSDRFSYEHDWSGYSTSKTNSAHDIEVLVQNMFSEQVKETCVDSSGEIKKENILRDDERENKTLTCEEGEEYKTEHLGMQKDEDKYKEFLETFLYEKYFTEDNASQDGVYLSGVTFMDSSFGEIMYYNQCDDPSARYGNIGSLCDYGCGPTALSIVISSMLKKEHNPVEVSNYVCSIGGCSTDGTYWSAITQTPPHYGLKVNNTGDTKQVIDALSKGDSLVIALMCVGHFTTSGHFITLTGTTSSGQVSVADPASRERSTNWDFNIVAEETCRSTSAPYWIISK